MLNILCLLEINLVKNSRRIPAGWLAVAQPWHWRGTCCMTAKLAWIWVRHDASRFPVLPKWLGNIRNDIVWLQNWALSAHKVCSSSSNLFGIQTLTVYAACQTSLCPLFHISMLFFYMVVHFTHTQSHMDICLPFRKLESSNNEKNPPGKWFKH